jgi:hypothetical protein
MCAWVCFVFFPSVILGFVLYISHFAHRAWVCFVLFQNRRIGFVSYQRISETWAWVRFRYFSRPDSWVCFAQFAFAHRAFGFVLYFSEPKNWLRFVPEHFREVGLGSFWIFLLSDPLWVCFVDLAYCSTSLGLFCIFLFPALWPRDSPSPLIISAGLGDKTSRRHFVWRYSFFKDQWILRQRQQSLRLAGSRADYSMRG